MNWPTGHNPANAGDWPLFDEIGWADYWSARDWMDWHRAMLRAYGLDAANTRFLEAWNQDSLSHSAPLDARSFDSSFRDYAKANGFYDALYGGKLAALAKPLGVIADAGDAVASIGSGVRLSGVWLKWLLPVAVAALLYFYTSKAASPALRRR